MLQIKELWTVFSSLFGPIIVTYGDWFGDQVFYCGMLCQCRIWIEKSLEDSLISATSIPIWRSQSFPRTNDPHFETHDRQKAFPVAAVNATTSDYLEPWNWVFLVLVGMPVFLDQQGNYNCCVVCCDFGQKVEISGLYRHMWQNVGRWSCFYLEALEARVTMHPGKI